MLLLAELGQILIAGAFSAAIAFVIGPLAYVLVAAFVLLTCVLLLFDAERHAEVPLSGKALLLHAAASAGTAFVFATIWPALPLIFLLTFVRKRAAGDRAP